MVTIYQNKYEKVPEKELIKQLLLSLPKNLYERANRYIFEKDAYNFVMGRLLLKRGLEGLGMAEHFNQIGYLKTGKPFLKNVFFNISHTDSLVVCVIYTEGEIGIDVEKVNPLEFSDFKPSFTNSEWEVINNAQFPIEQFYWYWTRKESIIKALGVDLSYLHLLEIDPSKNHFIANGKEWHLKTLDFGANFCGALCSEFPITDVKFIKCFVPEWL